MCIRPEVRSFHAVESSRQSSEMNFVLQLRHRHLVSCQVHSKKAKHWKFPVSGSNLRICNQPLFLPHCLQEVWETLLLHIYKMPGRKMGNWKISFLLNVSGAIWPHKNFCCSPHMALAMYWAAVALRLWVYEFITDDTHVNVG